ncbi:MAG: hypothetical protein DMD33_12150 [Gemmatimonadetes bacterium]|nr:MAG: hypothetical protein DMD33_12150 [Gemmatimonadota bacterium]PYO98455.1 MAG: hypothetical protein DMD61_09825 [Gemmatimonadota bacterium]TLY47485.1 MAG: hypothetical protein E6K55_14680 [Gemmatimonadota bacterium]
MQEVAPGAEVDHDETSVIRARAAVYEKHVAAKAKEVLGILVAPHEVAREAVRFATTRGCGPNKQIGPDLRSAALHYDIATVVVTDHTVGLIRADGIKRAHLRRKVAGPRD